MILPILLLSIYTPATQCEAIDGDTLRCSEIGRVRLLGIDAPEMPGHRNTDYQSPKGPIEHLPLGAQIIFAALCLVAGLYSACYAFVSGGRIGLGPAVGYLFAGIIGIGSGVALGLSIFTPC